MQASIQDGKMDRLSAPLVALIGVGFAGLTACDKSAVTSVDELAAADSAFALVQARGQQAMGVDQYTSTHFFDALPDGGRIELQRDVDDAAGIAHIRKHLEAIAQLFDAGDFSTPAFVHMQSVPGASVMTAKRDAITYAYRELPRGGEVRIVTQDAEALRAIHEFMSFQRQDHRAGGKDGHHGGKDHERHDHGGPHQGGPHQGSPHQGGTHNGGADHERRDHGGI
jgi:hypothetical protein